MRKLLFRVARSRYAALFIGFAFAQLTRLMPLKRLEEDALCILFWHPAAFWETHWLGVPKRAIPSFAAADFTTDGQHIATILQRLARTADRVLQQDDGTKSAFTLLVNGGQYQDVPQLHFHLFTGADRSGRMWQQERFVEPDRDVQTQRGIVTVERSGSNWAKHWQFSAETMPPADSLTITTNSLLALMQAAQHKAIEEQLDAYSVILNLGVKDPTLCIHLVSGKT